ncbi:MAG: hypothetical protein GVY02_03785, partial [Bacteroidetes bacterium]|nr:hypothetical protein [Bacteroidota bacterium]
MSETNNKKNGAEDVKWDLSDLYKSPSDPDLMSDMKQVVDQAETFQ